MIDIDGKELMEDIVSSVPEKSERAPPDRVDMQGSPTRERFKSPYNRDAGLFIFIPLYLLQHGSVSRKKRVSFLR